MSLAAMHVFRIRKKSSKVRSRGHQKITTIKKKNKNASDPKHANWATDILCDFNGSFHTRDFWSRKYVSKVCYRNWTALHLIFYWKCLIRCEHFRASRTLRGLIEFLGKMLAGVIYTLRIDQTVYSVENRVRNPKHDFEKWIRGIWGLNKLWLVLFDH